MLRFSIVPYAPIIEFVRNAWRTKA